MNEIDDGLICSSLEFLPEDLRQKLMPFQKDGVLFGIRKSGRCLIADEMGLGKTVQALALAYNYRVEWPLLIIVPSSLCYSWVEEVEKWFSDILPENINVIETGSDVGRISSSLITIVTYGLLRHSASHIVQEALCNQKFQVIIADESHYIKNRKAVSTKYIVPLVQEAKRRILLTGTPALNRPEELFSQLDALCPGAFGGWIQFAKHYCDAKFKFFGRQKRWITDGASNVEELQSRLSEMVMIRRLKKHVLTQLPPKRRQKITFKLKESNVRKELDALWEQLELVLRRSNTTVGQAFVSSSSNNQSAVSSSSEIYKLLSQLYTKTCTAKIGPVKEYVRMLCDSDNVKFIIFSYHRLMTDGIVEQLIESKVKFIRIDGSTVVQDRPRLVSQFQNDETTRVAVLSIKAAGVGLTLTAASLVVFAELDWTPGTLEQCEDRVHRIGQRGTVNVHYLVAAGSLDEWVWGALSRKTTVVAAVLNGEKKVLRMERGTSQQVDCLTNADAYIPAENSKTDINSLLQSQPTGQKTVLDYFLSQKDNCLVDDLESCTNPRSYLPSRDAPFQSLTCGTEQSRSSSTPLSESKIIVVESDDDSVAFKKDNWCQKRKLPEMSSSSLKEKRVSHTSVKRKKSRMRRSLKEKWKRLDMDNGEEGGWSCGSCTFRNLDVILSCEMCLKPRSKRLKDQAEMSEFSRESQMGSAGKDTSNHEDGGIIHISESSDVSLSSKELSQADLLSEDSSTGNNEVESKSDNVVLSEDNHVSKRIITEKRDEISKVRSHGIAEKSLPKCGIKDDESENESLFEACCSYLSNADLSFENSEATVTLCEEFNSSGTVSEIMDQEIPSFSETSTNELEIGATGEQNHISVPAKNLFDVSNHNLDVTQVHNLDDIPVSNSDNVSVLILDDLAVHSLLLFSCSQYTNRVYVYDKAGTPLHVSFLPLDVELENYADLPKLLLHPQHLQLISRFVREWNRLSQTKRRLIVRSGQVFVSPSAIYDQLKTGRVLTKQRYATKADVSALSSIKVAENGGSLRHISRTSGPSRAGNVTMPATDDVMTVLGGFIQAMNNEGNPLCLNCQSVFKTSLVTKATLDKYPWQTRLCSRTCFQEFWTRHNRGYSAQQVYNLEHGVCQMCQFDAHEFYENIRSIASFEKRAKMIQKSKYSILTKECKEKMIRQPKEGMFWNVDHILPVSEGGGQCDIDNLRTLCTVCHRNVTQQQNKDRPKQRLQQVAATCHDIKNFFRPL